MPLGTGPQKRPLPFELTITGDEEERNVVRTERYVVSVTRPGQPIEYWGECSALRLDCRGFAGSHATAQVRCTVTARRRFVGDVTVTVGEDDVTHARGAGEIDGTARVVNLTVTRALRRGQLYEAVALLERGGSARKFWTDFRAR